MSLRRIWILAETEHFRIKKVSFELIAWAASLADRKALNITAVVPGETKDIESLCRYGADKILYINDKRLNTFLPVPWANVLLPLLRREVPDVFLAAATTTGRTVMPYIAAKLRAGLTADCTELKLDTESGTLYQTRPAAGGNIMATIQTVKGSIQMATVRPNSIRILPENNNSAPDMEIVSPDKDSMSSDLTLLQSIPFDKTTEDLQEARIIISGGKGLKKRENFKLLERQAELLHAHIGASRDAVDKGWIDYPHQVGLSGKTVTPDLYIAAGISGAIQHLAGMQTSGTIVAVNNDPDAQIFNVSDFCVAADLFEFLPILTEHLERYFGETDE